MNQVLAFDTTLVWMIIVNALAAGLFFLAATRLPPGAVRVTFLAMLAASLVYLNPAIYFWHPAVDQAAKLFLARTVFTGALALALTVTVFLVFFTANVRELRRVRFWLFTASIAGLLLANAAGLVVVGVAPVGETFRLEYGPLHRPLVICYLIYFAYFSFIGWRGYRRCQNEMLQIQLKTLGLAGAVTFGAIVFTNGIIPALTGRSGFSPLAALEILIFYSAILYIILNGEALVVVRAVRDLLKTPEFQHGENRQGLRIVIQTLKHIVTGNPRTLHRRIELFTAEGNSASFFMCKGRAFEAGAISFEQGVPMEWYTGLQKSAARLEKENLRLAIGLEAAKLVMHRNQIKPPAAVIEPMPHPLFDHETEDPLETLALELKHPAMTFTLQQALDVMHQDEFERELNTGRILNVSDHLFRIAAPGRYLRLPEEEERSGRA